MSSKQSIEIYSKNTYVENLINDPPNNIDDNIKKRCYYKTNIIKKLFFCWVYNIIRINKLEINDLGCLDEDNKVNNLEKNILMYIDNNFSASSTMNTSTNKENNLLKIISKYHLWDIVIVALLSIVSVILKFILLLINEQIINSFSKTNQSFIDLKFLFIIYLSIIFVNSLIKRQTFYYENVLAYKISIELISVIFNKILLASCCNINVDFKKSKLLNKIILKNKSTEGEITNLIQIDCERIVETISVCPSALTIPFDIIAFIILLFKFFGWIAVFAIICIILLFIPLCYLLNSIIKYEEKYLEFKDTRMKITSYVLDYIKIIKMYNWNNYFCKEIIDLRDKEAGKLKLLYINVYWANMFFHIIPIITSIVTIGSYLIFNDFKINAVTIYSGFCVIYYINNSLNFIPYIIYSLINLSVSIRRIEHYISQPNKSDNLLYSSKLQHLREDKSSNINNDDLSLNTILNNYNIDYNISILIKDANFSWGFKDIKKIHNDNFDSQNDSQTNRNEELPINTKLAKVLKNINLSIKKQELVAIIGKVGSGKSSLLKSILKELVIIPNNKENIKCNEEINYSDFLYIDGDISYTPQSAWIFNGTIRENIVLSQDSHIDTKTINIYNNILDICELNQDLNELKLGDLTEVSSKGNTLSGGQKMRISLARSVYKNSDIYLFDNPLAALDSVVASNIFEKLILNYLNEKTRIVVLNNTNMLNKFDRIICLENGNIIFNGSYEEYKDNSICLNSNKELGRKLSKNKEEDMEEEVEEEEQFEACEDMYTSLNNNNKDDKKLLNSPNKKNNLLEEEERKEGHVQLKYYKLFINLFGGFKLLIILFLVSLIWITIVILSDFWIKYWIENLESNNSPKIFLINIDLHQIKTYLNNNPILYFIIYSFISVISILFVLLQQKIIIKGIIRMFRYLHLKMITSLIAAPINLFHDVQPKGRVLNRVSKDLENLNDLFGYISYLSTCLFEVLGVLFLCSYYNKYILISIPFIIVYSAIITKYYLYPSRDIKRLEGVTRSNIVNYISEMIPGASYINTCSEETKSIIKNKVNLKLDQLYLLLINQSGLENWFGLNFDILSFLYMSYGFFIIYLFKDNYSVISIGQILAYTVNLTDNFIFTITEICNIENTMVSLERCSYYTDITPEKDTIEMSNETLDIIDNKNLNLTNNDLDTWPLKGEIIFKDFSVKYRPDCNLALKNLNIIIQSGMKIGVVGRTGSGKSTLSLCMFRILEAYKGSIFIDEIDIKTVPLKKLRSSLTIIPQDPVIIEGSLRFNIDPENRCDDKSILNIINNIELFEFNNENTYNKGKELSISNSNSHSKHLKNKTNKLNTNNLKNNKINILEMNISEDNLSIGEKQLICIIRAIVRKSKIIILDEATSSIDLITEKKIQSLLDTHLKYSTVISIAHRINTIINYDKILVLDKGQVVEYDTPINLLNNSDSLFYSMNTKSIN